MMKEKIVNDVEIDFMNVPLEISCSLADIKCVILFK